MITKHFKALAYLIVALAVSSASAGSYEDFFVAIRNDNASSVASLLERGFDPNTRDPKGQPGLTIALQERAAKTAKLLLSQPQTDVNALNEAGESPLMMAALKGDLTAVQLLLDRGAKVNQPGWSPLHYAATGPEPKIVQLLIERGAEIDATSPNDTTPLMMAAQYGSEDSANLLLTRGADAGRRNQKGLRAVDFARISSRQALVKRLEQAAAPR
jgi:ankyrin repeat protein